MVSSTVLDLAPHRAVLVDVIMGQGLYPVAVEQDAALPVLRVDPSLADVVLELGLRSAEVRRTVDA